MNESAPADPYQVSPVLVAAVPSTETLFRLHTASCWPRAGTAGVRATRNTARAALAQKASQIEERAAGRERTSAHSTGGGGGGGGGVVSPFSWCVP
ncbi:MAG: hypothetical protein OXB92_02790, partial [Acidimicrobiaceae bacterium]|nr:hypothetical protein [Acidimicrobiaceae bacterium]